MHIHVCNILHTYTGKIIIKMNFIKLTIFIHSHVEAFFQSTSLTLISMSFVHDTATSTCLASKISNKSFFFQNSHQTYYSKEMFEIMCRYRPIFDLYTFFCKEILVEWRQSPSGINGQQFLLKWHLAHIVWYLHIVFSKIP